MGLTLATYIMIESMPANVLDFGADPTGVADTLPSHDNANPSITIEDTYVN